MTARNEHDENARKHLEFVQAVISRLATTSALIKAWALTLIAALYGYGAVQSDAQVTAVGIVAPLAFWFLDSFFLRQERLYRYLYERVRLGEIDLFDMNVERYAASEAWWKATLSVTLVVFYGLLAAVGLVLIAAG